MQILSNSISALKVRESPKFLRLKGNRVEEHDGDVRFKSGSVNMHNMNMHNMNMNMHNAYGHNYRVSSFTVDLTLW